MPRNRPLASPKVLLPDPAGDGPRDLARLEVLSSSIAGRSLVIEDSNDGTFADTATIFLDVSTYGSSDDAALVTTVQAALIAVGSLDRLPMERLSTASSSARDRYLALEVVRATQELEHLLPRLVRTRIANDVASALPSMGVLESVERALGNDEIASPPPWFGEIRPRQVLRILRHGPDGGLAGAAAPAPPTTLGQAEDDAATEDDSGERSRVLEMLSGPGQTRIGNALKRMMGTRRTAGNASGSRELLVASGSRRWGQGTWSPSPVLSGVKIGREVVRGARYPEWDQALQAYRWAWCTVGEFDPPASDGTPTPLRPDPRLVRELCRLGLRWRPHNGESIGDELDLTALVDYRASVVSGSAGDPLVYRAERRTAQELGALILLDATGSAAEHAEGQAIFDDQRRLASELTTALDRLGVRVATYGFYSRGRTNVRYLRCKSFDERWDFKAQRRLSAISPSGFTRLGAAVRHGTHLLQTQAGTHKRLLIVIGDGFAYDDGYEGRYAREDSLRAVEEAREHAVGCVGLSVRASSDVNAWPPDSHRVVEKPHELADVVRELFGNAIQRAVRGSV